MRGRGARLCLIAEAAGLGGRRPLASSRVVVDELVPVISRRACANGRNHPGVYARERLSVCVVHARVGVYASPCGSLTLANQDSTPGRPLALRPWLSHLESPPYPAAPSRSSAPAAATPDSATVIIASSRFAYIRRTCWRAVPRRRACAGAAARRSSSAKNCSISDPCLSKKRKSCGFVHDAAARPRTRWPGGAREQEQRVAARTAGRRGRRRYRPSCPETWGRARPRSRRSWCSQASLFLSF